MKLFIMLALFSSCAIRHHVQVGELDRPNGKKLTPFEVLISETGFNVQEAGELMSAITKDQGRSEEISNIIAMFQVGPTTGKQVYNEKYADILPELVLKKCPSGKVTGLLMVRESNQYPVVSGEIVKITGYCIN